MRWDSESQLIIWSCYYGSHLRLQIHSRPILCGILNQCWSWPCQILSHDICRSSFQLDIWIFLWCLDISLHPDVRDNLHTKRFGFTTGNRQLQLEIDYRLEFDYQQSICLFWKVLGWFENARMIWKVSGWSTKCVWMVWKMFRWYVKCAFSDSGKQFRGRCYLHLLMVFQLFHIMTSCRLAAGGALVLSTVWLDCYFSLGSNTISPSTLGSTFHTFMF